VSWWHLAQFFATDGTRDLMYYRNLTEGNPRRQLDPRSQRGASASRRGSRPAAPSRGGDRRAPATPAVDADEDLTPLGPDDAASVVQREDVSPSWINATREFMRKHGFPLDDSARLLNAPGDGPKFSHAWVADGKTTGTGGAVLVSKPQTPVTNPSLLYEFHIKGDSIDARGCGIAGSPIILIGWTPKVAWGMTALGADQADLFRLKTDDEHPNQYEFDGQWRSMRTIRETINVKGGRPRDLEIRLTHFGPVVSEFAFARPGDPLVAIRRVPICETDRETLQGAIAMMRAANVDEFFQALAGWRFPTANVVFGDAEGRIGYSTAGALVLRSPQALEGGFAAHDGSDSGHDWKAIIPQKLVPHVIDPARGYLFSGNHCPIASGAGLPVQRQPLPDRFLLLDPHRHPHWLWRRYTPVTQAASDVRGLRIADCRGPVEDER
jgi:acyl-homoserine lactone acylase PvdQ